MWTFPPKGFPEIKKIARCEASEKGALKRSRAANRPRNWNKSSKKLEQIIQETS